MARSRQLKPDFFLNEDLAALGALTRLLFGGLWLLADREGRLEDRPARIKAQLFPYHEAAVDDMLNDLSPMFIARYEAAGNRYVQIVNFKKHQHIHPDEKASVIPAPSEIAGDRRGSPGITPCSPSSSPSPSPSPTTAAPSAADLCGRVDKSLKRTDEELLELQLPFSCGDVPKGRRIIDIDPVSAQAIIDKVPRLGLDVRRALQYRIKLKTDELHPRLRRK